MDTQKIINGVRVNELFGTIDAVKKAPVIARVKFRANNKWMDCGHNRTPPANLPVCLERATRRLISIEDDGTFLILQFFRGFGRVEAGKAGRGSQ